MADLVFETILNKPNQCGIPDRNNAGGTFNRIPSTQVAVKWFYQKFQKNGKNEIGTAEVLLCQLLNDLVFIIINICWKRHQVWVILSSREPWRGQVQVEGPFQKVSKATEIRLIYSQRHVYSLLLRIHYHILSLVRHFKLALNSLIFESYYDLSLQILYAETKWE